MERVGWKNKQKWMGEPEAELQGEVVVIDAGRVGFKGDEWVTSSALRIRERETGQHLGYGSSKAETGGRRMSMGECYSVRDMGVQLRC